MSDIISPAEMPPPEFSAGRLAKLGTAADAYLAGRVTRPSEIRVIPHTAESLAAFRARLEAREKPAKREPVYAPRRTAVPPVRHAPSSIAPAEPAPPVPPTPASPPPTPAPEPVPPRRRKPSRRSRGRARTAVTAAPVLDPNFTNLGEVILHRLGLLQ